VSKDELFKSSKGGSVFHDSKAKTISVDFQSRDEIDDLWRAVDLKTGGEPLPTLTCVGTNSGDYVLLPDLDRVLQNSVKILRFHCSHCYARVAQGRLNSAVDRILACRCMAVLFREDVRLPRSGAEWAAFRDQWLKGNVRHRAAAADGNS
jgi:hypothetical protein